ncbi:hypothetical protein ACTFIW_010278 [Dictyostelium discoideum]
MIRKEIDNINEKFNKDIDIDSTNYRELQIIAKSFKDIEPVEIYFWKVFRNIVIFKHIFSKFKSKQYGYYDLIGFDGTYLNGRINSFEIIIDSIKILNFEEKNSKIEFTTTLTTTTNILSPKKSEDFGCLTIGKTESFNFTISIRILLICFYNLDRVDYIIYLFDKLPKVLFNPNYFSIFTIEYCLYSSSSSYYLELFINYFMKI